MSGVVRHPVCALAALGVLGSATASATASAGAAPPTVTIVSGNGTVFNHVSCEGVERLSPGSGVFQVFRDRAEPEPLSVTLSYGGTLEPGVD